MRVVRFVEGSSCRVGVEISDGGKIVDVCAVDSSIPRDMKTFLEGGAKNLKAAERACKTAELSGQHVLERSRIHLKAPIHDPEKVICIGMNYSDHCEEQNKPIPKEPLIFSKFASAIIDPGAPIIYSEETQELDWEVELVIVIGRKGKNIKKEDAMQYVAGYTVAHDVSARDWQLRKNGGQWLIGKTFDSYCPLGPAIVTADSISDPHSLGIRCRVNGVVMQNSTTSKMVFRTEDLLAFISRFFALNPGDIILTGTPPGVGCFRKPPIFLKKGDVVECEIDEIGSISNKVEAMPNIQANL